MVGEEEVPEEKKSWDCKTKSDYKTSEASSQMDQVKSAFATEPSGGGSEKVTENSLDAVSVLGFVGPKLSPTTKTVGNEIKKECAHKSRAQDSVGFQPVFRPHPVRPAPGVQLAKHAVHPLSPASNKVELEPGDDGEDTNSSEDEKEMQPHIQRHKQDFAVAFHRTHDVQVQETSSSHRIVNG
ncbi:hypothetical protein U1Q18_009946 [Sarracenia purpurea var. burkii]